MSSSSGMSCLIPASLEKSKWTENWRLRQKSEVNCIIAATPPVSLGIQLTVELLPEMFPSNHVIWGWKKPEVLVMPEIRGNNLVSFFLTSCYLRQSWKRLAMETSQPVYSDASLSLKFPYAELNSYKDDLSFHLPVVVFKNYSFPSFLQQSFMYLEHNTACSTLRIRLFHFFLVSCFHSAHFIVGFWTFVSWSLSV